MNFIVTTTQTEKNCPPLLAAFLKDSGFEFVPRGRKSLEALTAENQADGVIVWEKQGPVLYVEDKKFFFHPSMAKNRIAFYRNENRSDLLIQACQLKKGDSFLDCTLGLGADSIVASYFSQTGCITGLERQTAVAWVISWGMKLYQSRMPWLDEAIKRIKVENQDHKLYLSNLADGAYDLVYFDPMFQKPILSSQAISPLRKLADHSPLEVDTIKEACRVARKRVVMKDLSTGQELERLGFTKIVGGRHNRLAYGVINLQ